MKSINVSLELFKAISSEIFIISNGKLNDLMLFSGNKLWFKASLKFWNDKLYKEIIRFI